MLHLCMSKLPPGWNRDAVSNQALACMLSTLVLLSANIRNRKPSRNAIRGLSHSFLLPSLLTFSAASLNTTLHPLPYATHCDLLHTSLQPTVVHYLMQPTAHAPYKLLRPIATCCTLATASTAHAHCKVQRPIVTYCTQVCNPLHTSYCNGCSSC